MPNLPWYEEDTIAEAVDKYSAPYAVQTNFRSAIWTTKKAEFANLAKIF